MIGVVLLLLLASIAGAQEPEPQDAIGAQAALGTAFTYQGELINADGPVTGVCDFQYSLWDAQADGAQIGSTQAVNGVSVSDGRFTVELNGSGQFGASAFTGNERYLQIAVQCTGDTGFTTLNPRQKLTSAPYALYTKSAPWSGLRGVPGDLADGDDDTTYSAGAGLSLAGAQFSVGTAYRLPQTCGHGQIAEWNGSTWACGDDDVGAGGGGGDITAVYAGAGLSGGGTSDDVTLSADTGYLQRRVGDTCSSGNAIRAIGADGSVTCESLAGGSDHNHLGQTWTGSDNSLKIEGSFVLPDPAPLVLSNSHGDGLLVDSAGYDGVVVVSAGGDGVRVDSAHTGVNVGSATLGFRIASADTGVRVDSANGDGIHIESAVYDGVDIETAMIGVRVGAASAGMYVDSATTGMTVMSATTGINVGSATTAIHVGSVTDGVIVQSADEKGLRVVSATDGVVVESAAADGLRVESAGVDGVDATSTSALFYGGRFRNTASGGAGLYARGGSSGAPDIVLGGTASNDGRIYSDPAGSSSDIWLVSNDDVEVRLDNNSGEAGLFRIVEDGGFGVFSVDELGNMVALGSKTALVTTQDYGQRKLYAVESAQNWFEDFGSAELETGIATVTIEPIFAQTVNLTETYHVFLTPLGDCPLYVAEKTWESFTVKAIGGRECSIAFDYRIVAKRLGYEHVRLEAATLDTMEGSEP